MDIGYLVLDLTDAALARHRTVACDRCAGRDDLYRLIGTTRALCRTCFTAVHVAPADQIRA